MVEVVVNNVTKRYVVKEGKRSFSVTAADSVYFKAPSGQITTLLGPSGCGKSTILRCIAGLEVPEKGEIVISDKIVYSSEKKIFVPPDKRNVGMVFQSYAVWPHMTVFENVAYPLKLRKYPMEEIRRRVKQVLSLVRLEGLENRNATQLSGGQQQRVALARALVYEPQVLLMDEPLSNLDAKVREEVRGEIRQLQNELKITTIYVTHDLREALAISDMICLMNNGKIVEVGHPSKLYASPESVFAAEFLGYANILKGRIVNTSAVETEIGKVIHRDHAHRDFGPKDVFVAFRPEAVIVSPSAGRGDVDVRSNEWIGTVRSQLYLGNEIQLKISIGETIITAVVDPNIDVKPGDNVKVRVEPHNVILLKG